MINAVLAAGTVILRGTAGERSVGARPERVAIVGAGIGGLTLALALRRYGIEAEVFEQADRLAEIGAGVALAANGTRHLERLGLGASLAAVGTEPTELIVRDGRDGVRIAAHPVRQGAWYREHCGGPFYGVHRRDLQRILGAAWGDVRLGHRLVALADGPDRARLTFSDGTTAEADVVVGADGIRSTVRQAIAGTEAPVYSRTSGFRGVVPADAAPSLLDAQALQMWIGPGAHVVTYSLGPDAGLVNFLVVVDGPPEWVSREGWRRRADPAEAAVFADWHPGIAELLAAAPPVERWGLFSLPALPAWSRGHVVLLGDAAHGMLPHQGQGANQTIEDAVVLARLLATSDSLPAAFGGYERLRRGRTRRVQYLSRRTNDLLHLAAGPAARERDVMFQELPRHLLWIHSHDAG
jgi:salicylate hydroxylase